MDLFSMFMVSIRGPYFSIFWFGLLLLFLQICGRIISNAKLIFKTRSNDRKKTAILNTLDIAIDLCVMAIGATFAITLVENVDPGTAEISAIQNIVYAIFMSTCIWLMFFRKTREHLGYNLL